jgi:hypothetical protein
MKKKRSGNQAKNLKSRINYCQEKVNIIKTLREVKRKKIIPLITTIMKITMLRRRCQMFN